MNINECVNLISKLPDILIEHEGIILNWDSDNDFDKAIKALRFQYRAIGDWLKFYLCDCPEFEFELRNTFKANFKPLAERSRAFYQLIQETSLLSDFLKIRKLKATQLLYFIEREICKNILKNTGITHKPIVVGKKEFYENTKLRCTNLEDSNKHNFFKHEKIKTYIDLLVNEALEIKSIPENIEFREHFRDFLKSVQRCEDKLRRNPNIQNGYLENNKFILLDGKGKRKK